MALETGAFMQASSYSAEIVRRAMFAQYARTSANNPGIISGGLIGATDFQISQLGSPNMSVNVSTGEAIVPGNEGGSQGGYYVRGTSTSNLPISTANPSNPRVDTVCLTCGDAQYTLPSGGTSGSLTLQVVTGTPTAGASLSNLSGAAALPGSSLLLGYVLVPAGASSIVSGDIKNVATATEPQLGVSSFNGNTGAVTGITSFNGRTAAVVSQVSDYSVSSLGLNWSTPWTYGTNWAAGSSPGLMVDATGEIMFQGSVACSTSIASGNTVLQLSSSSQFPAVQAEFAATLQTNAGARFPCDLVITTGGTLTVNWASAIAGSQTDPTIWLTPIRYLP